MIHLCNNREFPEEKLKRPFKIGKNTYEMICNELWEGWCYIKCDRYITYVDVNSGPQSKITKENKLILVNF